MIEEDEFLDRAGIEFAVGPEFQGDPRKPIGFPSGIDPEGVGFALCHSGGRVDERGDEKKKVENSNASTGETGWIRYAANSPTLTPTTHDPLKESARKYECGKDEKTKIQKQFDPVVEHIMPHAMTMRMSGRVRSAR